MCSQFADNFWDPEFNSVNGYEVLMKRSKDGREMCKEYEDFLKQRSKAERSYAENLINLARKAGGKEEIGTLKGSWVALVEQTENIGLKHMDMCNQLLDEARKVEEFREKQRENKRKPIETIKASQANKKDWHNKVVQSKKAYESRCKEKDTSEEAHSKNKLIAPPKELEKLQQRCDKAKLAYETAENTYKSFIENLEEARQQWEQEMVKFCATMQHMEEERIKFLRGHLWTFTNMCSLQCVHDDQVYENVRSVLESCDEMQDIDTFVIRKGSSKRRPACIVFEDYYKNKSNNGSPSSSLNGGHQGGLHARRLPQLPDRTPSVSSEGAYACVDDLSTRF
ncbi:proline-serine-threonine phosphatase-interacting protein 1-like [Amphiura filiformis]|uniref:proline-serine-threonine phosphatase-interacting protein 1-like n=1 Tax=Amphiura filiformis TaxID=82378 RepID=UPI003B210A71